MNAFLKITVIIFTLLFAYIFPFNTAAQVKFQEYYGVKPFNYEVSHGAIQTLDGGYIFAGETHDDAGLVPWDLYVVKTDSSGNKLWSKRYHNLNGSNHPAGSVIATSDSGFAMAPMTNSGDIRIVKFDKTGNLLWSYQYGAGYGSPRSIIQTLDGGFAIVGDEYYFTPNVFKAYVVKINAAGNLQWDKAIYSTSTLRGCDIVQITDSSYVICGIDQSWATPSNVLLYKLSKTGAVQWAKSIGSAILDEAYGIYKTNDNGFIIAGNTNINGTDIMIIKTDSGGTIQWAKAYGTAGYDGVSNSHVIQADANGGYSCFAFTMNGLVGGSDLLLFKTDAGGNLSWAKTYGSIYNESGYASGLQTSDGGYLMTGRRAGNLLGDLLAIKTDTSGSCGCSEATISLTTTALTLTSSTVVPQVVSGGTSSTQTYSSVNIYNDSAIVCKSSAPLPIELVSFYGENKNEVNQLYWTTASETNNNYFDIEKSTDGKIFKKTGRVDGSGNSTQILNYSFEDILPGGGINYYRLKQTDFNGCFTYSKTISIQSRLNGMTAITYFTSTDNLLHIFIQSSTDKFFLCEVYNSQGKSVFKNQIKSNSNIEINTANYLNGIYLIRIGNGNYQNTFKQLKH